MIHKTQAPLPYEFGFLAIAVYRPGRWSRTNRPCWLSLPVQ
ncbi:hypothetical protein [Wenzhouxiangella sp. EGI_FJ10305]